MGDINLQDIGLHLGDQQQNENKQQQMIGRTKTKQYNPNKSPPDYKEAKKHGIAKRLYKNEKLDLDDPNNEFDPETGLPINGTKLGLCCELSELYELGSGYALYFSFLKFAMLLLTIMFAITGIYSLISNRVGDDCFDPSTNDDDQAAEYCVNTYDTLLAVSNHRDSEKVLEVQVILNLVFVIILVIFFQFFRFWMRKIAIDADDRAVTPSDYSIIIKRLNPDITDENLKEYLEKMLEKYQFHGKVEKITRAYDILEYMELFTKKAKLIKKSHSGKTEEERAEAKKECKEVSKQLKEKKKEIKTTHIAFVSISDAHSADFLVRQFKVSAIKRFLEITFPCVDNERKINGKRVHCSVPAEPTDLIWPNMCYSTSIKFKNRAITNFVTVILVAMGFGLIVLLYYGQGRVIEESGDGSRLIDVLSFIVSILVSMINYILKVVILKLSGYEKHSTYTNFYKAFAEKLSIAQFVSSAFTTLAAKLVLIGNFQDSAQVNDSLRAINFYGKGGLLNSMFFIFITNTVLNPGMTLFNPFWFLRKFKQWKVQKTPAEESNKIQSEVNSMFELPAFNLSYKYASLIKNMLVCSFYASAMPIAIVIQFVALALQYWADKISLLRTTALPVAMGKEISDAMIEQLEYFAFFFAIGQLIFIRTLQNTQGDLAYPTSSNVLVYVMIVISLVNMIFPMEVLNKILFKIKNDVTENTNFKQARIREFSTDYDVENPITRTKALKKYFALVDAAKQVAKDEGYNDDDEMFKKIKPADFDEKITKKLDKTTDIEDDDELEDDDEDYLERMAAGFGGKMVIGETKTGSHKNAKTGTPAIFGNTEFAKNLNAKDMAISLGIKSNNKPGKNLDQEAAPKVANDKEEEPKPESEQDSANLEDANMGEDDHHVTPKRN